MSLNDPQRTFWLEAISQPDKQTILISVRDEAPACHLILIRLPASGWAAASSTHCHSN
jgi:hypothetical protein